MLLKAVQDLLDLGGSYIVDNLPDVARNALGAKGISFETAMGFLGSM